MKIIPKMMKGVQLIAHGGTEVLKFNNDIPVPTVTENEVLIQISAAAVNNTDINTRTAWYSKDDASNADASWSGNAIVFPRIQGADVCGFIVAVGDKVSKSRIGERVIIEPCLNEVGGKTLSSHGYYGSECDGGFAEYTVVADKYAYAIQSELSDIELASFPCSYSTAENMLSRANVIAKDRVLISGASGGVGSATIQLAKARGAHVIAITSMDKKQNILALGADEVILRDDNLVEVLGENSIDVVVDLVAGKQWQQFLQILMPGGRYAVSGAIGGHLVELDVRTLYLKDLSFFGCTVLAPDVFHNLVLCIEQGKIKPLVSHVFLLEDIVKAQEAFLEKKHIGKIVLNVSDSLD